jgi:ABC-type nitrate/sulfonate/bicarbonate transport system substrate-binding protein
MDFSRAQSLRGLENALSLEGLAVKDVELVDYVRERKFGDDQQKDVGGTLVSTGSRGNSFNNELIGLLRREVDAIFLKGAHGAQAAHDFGLVTVIDTGSHPDPLIRSNNGTPRTLTVDANLIENHFDATVTIVEQVLRAQAWAHSHPDETRRFLARETNSSEYWTRVAYGEDAHDRLKTDLAESSINAIQHFTDFLARHKLIPESFKVRDWVDVRPFEAVQQRRAAI